ncbi:putative spindle assembly checkpoint kinase [Tetrabaena socialis]|uniref:Putative spindle assembly checkpoint kinase n=1 Tax=Tetrabaena socialis TaxID=47790 RepID=A0A2J8A7M4_9CHLO|nr:putative spindle assembly checkpoint kinase [Tetrabaena socialis]|eukprot:PNH08521.1 putative spindle assembly checkpoint kinase [Tetrabaena socialis]
MGLASTEQCLPQKDLGPPARVPEQERDADKAKGWDQNTEDSATATAPEAPIAKRMAWWLAAAAAAADGVRRSVLRIPRHPDSRETPATEGPHSDSRLLRRERQAAREAARSTPPLEYPCAASSAQPASSSAPVHHRRTGLEPREDPPQGLLYLAPSARASMWCAQRGANWSLSQYGLTRQLYAGYNASVWQATCRTSGLAVVLKCYSLATLSDYLRHQALRELDIHSRLRHPDLVQLLAAFRSGDELVLVMEWVPGGSLERARRKLGGRMSEQQALHLVVLPLLRALCHLHAKGIIHRDLKPVGRLGGGWGLVGGSGVRTAPVQQAKMPSPGHVLCVVDNVLFGSDWRLKLCDFGVALATLEERAVTRAGTVPYLAPEVQACPLKQAPADNKDSDDLAYGTAADVWSLGVLVYETLVGFAPFPLGPADGSPAAGGAEGARSLPYPSSISAKARAFIGACLERLPGDRPTVQQLLRMEWAADVHQVGAELARARAGLARAVWRAVWRAVGGWVNACERSPEPADKQ